MANAIYEAQRELALGAGLDWVSQDYRAALVDLDTADGFGIAVTGATNATPIVITVATAPATGSVVSIQGITGNTNANGHFRVTNLTGTTFSIQDYVTDVNVAGNGVFGGADPNFFRLDGDINLDDIPGGARHAILTSTITGKAIVNGAADSDDWTWSSVPADGGDDSDLVVVYEHTGVEATSRLLLAITEATGLPVIPNGGDISLIVNNNVHRLFRL